MSLPTGIATIDESSLKYGRKLGAGGFADVYCATWTRGTLEEEQEEGCEGEGCEGEGAQAGVEEDEGGEAGGRAGAERGRHASTGDEAGAAPPDPQLPLPPSAHPGAAINGETASRIDVAGRDGFAAQPARNEAASVCCPAHDGRPSRPRLCVAVKRLHSAPENATLMSAFCHEIGLMKRLDHPNVLRLYGVTVSP
eukprot:scaffold21699_cov54-Isochrysis_galbana.AAC.1